MAAEPIDTQAKDMCSSMVGAFSSHMDSISLTKLEIGDNKKNPKSGASDRSAS
ncbi:hypothetical protein M569_16926 [Genlisea aurea]|uniref:Uncharacterized protein n=1 Tax=Genlisea aurea TaxID=192259 RepID=S8DEW4_9LAMI|nr:hypothetical protein M569_16926 [Genlisea aurea]